MSQRPASLRTTALAGSRVLLCLALSATAQAKEPRGELRDQLQALADRHFGPLVSDKRASADKAPGGIVGIYFRGERFFFPYGRVDEAGTAPTPNTVFGL